MRRSVARSLDEGNEPNAQRDPVHRLSHLDGLRGLAILLVMLFHAYARWPDHVPFGAEFADVFVFKTGFNPASISFS